MFFATSTIGQYVFVYKYDGSNYTRQQTIQYSNSGYYRRVSLTDDHMYMTVSGGDDDVSYIYKYN